MAADILIVDDEADIRDLVAGILQDEGFDARTARNSDDALAAIAARKPNLVFLDIWLQGSKLDGLQLLDAIKLEHPEVPVVMISGHGNIETAVARHQARRLRFHREAVQGRPPGAGGRAGARDVAAQARGQAAQADGAAAGDADRPFRGHRATAPDHGTRGADQ